MIESQRRRGSLRSGGELVPAVRRGGNAIGQRRQRSGAGATPAGRNDTVSRPTKNESGMRSTTPRFRMLYPLTARKYRPLARGILPGSGPKVKQRVLNRHMEC